VAGAVFLVARGDRARRARTGYARWPLRFALGWVALELLRSLIPALGTWGFVGYAMYRQSWFIQPVSAFGMFGLDLLIVIANCALTMLFIAWLDRRWVPDVVPAVDWRLASRWCAGSLAACAAWFLLSIAMRPAGDGATVRIAALQPGSRRWQLGSTAEASEHEMLALLSEQTRRAAAQGARVVVWPESALGMDPALAHRDELAALARETGAYLFVGYLVDTPRGHRNEVVTVDPTGAFLGIFGKDHPVVFLHGTSISRGTYPTYPTPFGRVGAMICADTDFTDTARALARGGAKVLAVPSADWPAIARSHYVLSVFRALETGAAVAKSEYSRDSIIVDGAGNIVASAITPEGSAAVLCADVALRPGLPLAARFGDWIGWVCVGWLFLEIVGTRLGQTFAQRFRLGRLLGM